MLFALLVTSLATSLLIGWTEANRQTALEAGRLQQTARVIGSLSADAVAVSDRQGAFEALRAISQMPEISYGRIRDGSGVLLAETGGGIRLSSDAALSDDARPSVWSVLNTGTIQVRAPVVRQDEAVGEIVILAKTPGLRERVAASVAVALLGTLVAALLGLLIALRLARKISTPMVELADFTNRVRTTGDYGEDPVVQADDEVRDVADGLAAMLAGLRERDARIADHVADLENQVSARTAELNDAKVVAEMANAAKSDFLAVMSHEIRTPMNGMLALSELLASADLAAPQKRQAQVILQSGRALLEIINDVLDFSKVEAGKLELEQLLFDPNDLLDDVAALFAQRAKEKQLDLAVYVDPRIGSVSSDPTRLRQVVSNLANNAIKFTQSGGVTLAVTASTSGKTLRFAIIDTGPGIDPAKLPRLFEAFSQEDQTTTRKHGGTGLGLAICDRLVTALGAKWALASKPGVGSRFAFDLSVAPSSAAEVVDLSGVAIHVSGDEGQTSQAVREYLKLWGATETDDKDGLGLEILPGDKVLLRYRRPGEGMASHELAWPLRRDQLASALCDLKAGVAIADQVLEVADVSSVAFPGARVLVVDDSEVNREVASEALNRLGVDVDFACDGVEAVEAVKAGRFDLVLMDGSMPRMDGFEASQAIRAWELETAAARTPIVAVTAHVVGRQAEAWRDAGMDGVVHKPFTIGDVVRTLRTHCGAFEGEAASDHAPTEVKTSSAPVDEDLFDPAAREELNRMAQAGKADFVDRIQALYREHAPLRLAEISQAVDDNNPSEVARAAHALKSMSLSLGARAVAAACAEIEQAGRSERIVGGSRERLGLLLERTLLALRGDQDAPPASDWPARLRRAIANGEIGVVFQPMMDRQGGFAGKAEVLVRWTTQEGETMRPDIFIPEIEAAGAIELLTDHVLHLAMTTARDRSDIRIAVNASAVEFQAENFADRVRDAADRAGYPLSRLEIEITETAILDIEKARPTLGRLADLGVTVALDDFGSGYSSLHALRELKFSTLKIDKSFVDRCLDDTASAAIIHAVIAVGRSLGMSVVCEGVETDEQARFMRTAGVHLIQGYVYARPGPFDALPSLDQQAA